MLTWYSGFTPEEHLKLSLVPYFAIAAVHYSKTDLPPLYFLQRLTGHLQWYIAKVNEIVVENEALYLAWSWSVQSGQSQNLPFFFFFWGPLCILVKKSCPQRQMPINLKSNKSGHHSSSVGIYSHLLICHSVLPVTWIRNRTAEQPFLVTTARPTSSTTLGHPLCAVWFVLWCTTARGSVLQFACWRQLQRILHQRAMPVDDPVSCFLS